MGAACLSGGSARRSAARLWFCAAVLAAAVASCAGSPPMVATGGDQSCAVEEGDAYCWGTGFIGNGDTSGVGSPSPQLVAGDHNWTTLSVGDSFVCGLEATNSSVLCWGYGGLGAIGNRLKQNAYKPTKVVGLPGAALDVSAGAATVCAVVGTGGAGQVYCWGDCTYHTCGFKNTDAGPTAGPLRADIFNKSQSFEQVSVGGKHACAVEAGGKHILCWGVNDWGQLGYPNDWEHNNLNTAPGTKYPSPVGLQLSGNTTWKLVTAGGSHTCGVLSNGSAYCWGLQWYGETGSPNYTRPDGTPQLVGGNYTWESLSAGDNHTCGVLLGEQADRIACFGASAAGQLGDGNRDQNMLGSTPRLVVGDETWSQVDAGANQTCGVKTTGTIACWGDGLGGKLGNPVKAQLDANPTPLDVTLPLPEPPPVSPPPPPPPPKSSNTAAIVGGVVGGLAALAVLLIALYICQRRSKNPIFPALSKRGSSGFSLSPGGSGGLLAVDYFLNRDGSRVTLGEGGFGKVYKGKLLDGTLVAIKALKRFTGASIDASGGEGDLEKGSGGGKGVDGSGGDSGGKGFGSSDGSDGNGGISSDETGERSSQGSKPKKGSAFSPFGSLFSSRPALRGGSRGSGTGSGTGSSSTGSGTRSSNDEGRRASAAAEESKKLTRQLVDEAAILQQCDHECLVHFYGACMLPTEILLVMEYVPGGSLFDSLHRAGGVTWENCGRQYALDVARGLAFLHSRRILHLDVKSANVLLTGSGRAKLADFGLAQSLPQSVTHLATDQQVGGTLAYTAPEVLMYKKTTFKADVFSFGVLLHEICSGEAPNRRRTLSSQIRAPLEVVELFRACIESDPEQRPTAEQVVAVLEASPTTLTLAY